MPDIAPEHVRAALEGLSPEQQHQFLDELEKRHAAASADFSDVQGGSTVTRSGDKTAGLMGYPDPMEALKGAGKSAVNTAIGLGSLPYRAAAALGVKSAEPYVGEANAQHKELAPQSRSEQTGQTIEQLAEHIIPGSKLAGATKTAPFIARLLANAGLTGVTQGAQGGSLTDAAFGAATGGLSESLGTALPAVLRSSAVQNWMKILSKSGLNPFQKASLREALASVADDLPVGTTKGLAEKTAGITEDAGQRVADVFKPLENKPMSLSKPVSELRQMVEAPVTQGGRTIQAGRPEVRFNDLSPQAQDAHLDQVLQVVAPGTTFSQLPPNIQSAVRSQAANVNDVVHEGVKEILDSPTAGNALRRVTSRVGEVADIAPQPKVGQVRGLRQGLGEDASKALELGVVTPEGEALKAAGGQVTKAIHKQFPQTVEPDATYSSWRKISDQMQKSLDASPEKVSAFAKYYAAKIGIAGALGGATGEATGQGHTKSAAIALGAMTGMAVSQSGLWNSMSAATKNWLANLIEQGNQEGAARALKAATLVYVSRIRQNNKLAREEAAKQSQRTGVMVE